MRNFRGIFFVSSDDRLLQRLRRFLRHSYDFNQRSDDFFDTPTTLINAPSIAAVNRAGNQYYSINDFSLLLRR
ncbi:hypothetical protein LXL04_022538 [Taraxacum kok-saghyz]